MRNNNIVALLDMLGLLLTAAIDITFLSSIDNYLNYRQGTITEWFYWWIMIALALFFLGIYTIYLVSCLVIEVIDLIAGNFKRSESTSNLKFSLLRILIPCAIFLTFILATNHGFPGVAASAEVRQQWAYKEFWNYGGVVDSIKNCQPIINRVGSVKFVAPTQGPNNVVYDPGSSGHSGELTLEVVGDQGIGVAYSYFHIGTSVSSVKFTYQKRTEQLSCNR